MRALRTTKVDPDCPPLREHVHIQGQVILSVQISKSGDVASLKLISGHPLLVPCAIEGVKQWKYKPYLLDGDPVEVDTLVRLNFTTSSSGAIEVTDAPLVVDPPSMPAGMPIPRRIRVSSEVAQGMLVKKVNPDYPPEAKHVHVQGTVLLKVNIDEDGKVATVELISGHPLLAPAAVDAVKQWKYKPYLLNNVPVEVETNVEVNFSLME